MPVLSKLSANGNYTIAGTFDEATFNRNSGYRKNTITYSQDYTAAGSYWIKQNISILSTDVIAPDNTPTATLFGKNINGYCVLYRDTAFTQPGGPYPPGLIWTMSGYFKAGTSDKIRLTVGQPSTLNNYLYADFNLTTVTASAITYAGQSSNGSTKISYVRNGWYRCSITGYINSFSTYIRTDYVFSSLTGDSTNVALSTINVWGLQLEIGGLTDYEVTDANALPISNTASRLDTSGNFYTAGQIDEVTYNKTNPVFKNLLTYTESFNTSVWSPNLGIVVPNAILAPDGKSYAIKLVERIDGSSPTSNQRLYYKPAVDAQTVYTFSVYLKPAERGYVRIYFEDTTGPTPDGGGRIGALLNLFTGTITSTYSTGTNTLLGSNLQKLDDGWFRYSWTVKTFISSPANGTAYIIVGMGNTPTNFAYAGDGYSGMYFWGAQMEKGPQVTTYQGVGAPGVIVDSNTTTRLESSGNHYLAGSKTSYDEVTGIPPITDSIVLYLDPNIPESYPGTGTTWFDLSGNKNNGTLIASAAINTNYSTKGIKFVFGSVTQFAASSKLNFSGLLPYTLESWIYPHTVTPVLNYPTIFNKNNQTPVRNGFVFLITGADASNQLLYSERWGNGVTLLNVSETISNTSFINKWHHCVIVFDGSVLRLYRNGVLTGTSSTSVVGIPSLGDNQNLQIGNQNLTLGRTVIYNRALSATEIQATYNATKLGYAY